MDDITNSRLDATCAQTFIARRLDPQLAWFEAKALQAKRWHFGLTGAQIAATGLIPVVNLLPYGAVSSTLLAAVAGIAAGFGALGGHQAHWQRYRATAAALQKLRLHHELRLPPFEDWQADSKLIEEVEALLGSEHEDWGEVVRAATGGKAVKAKKQSKDGDD